MERMAVVNSIYDLAEELAGKLLLQLAVGNHKIYHFATRGILHHNEDMLWTLEHLSESKVIL